MLAVKENLEEQQIVPAGKVEVEDDELQELLDRLHAAQFDYASTQPTEKPHKVTVEDIAEALGLHPDDVEAELHRMHEEHREAQVSAGLRELEAPLYRVERPGHGPTVGHENPLFRLKSVRTLAERQKEVRFDRRAPDHRLAWQDKFISYAIIVVMGLIALLVALQAVASLTR